MFCDWSLHRRARPHGKYLRHRPLLGDTEVAKRGFADREMRRLSRMPPGKEDRRHRRPSVGARPGSSPLNQSIGALFGSCSGYGRDSVPAVVQGPGGREPRQRWETGWCEESGRRIRNQGSRASRGVTGHKSCRFPRRPPSPKASATGGALKGRMAPARYHPMFADGRCGLEGDGN